MPALPKREFSAVGPNFNAADSSEADVYLFHRTSREGLCPESKRSLARAELCLSARDGRNAMEPALKTMADPSSRPAYHLLETSFLSGCRISFCSRQLFMSAT